MKHRDGAIGAWMAVDRYADTQSLVVGAGRLRTELTEDERDYARAAINNAMHSVGHVLEAALQAMTNLRAASAALEPSQLGRPSSSDVGGAEKSN